MPVREAGKDLAAALQFFGNMGLCQNERLSGDGDDSLIRSASRVRWQLTSDFGCDVTSNNCEVAIFKLEDIRTALRTRGFRAAQVWIGTKST
jgi:hypothetical protein